MVCLGADLVACAPRTILGGGAEWFVVHVPPRANHLDRFRVNLRNFMTECRLDFGDAQGMTTPITKQYGGQCMDWDGGDRYNIVGMYSLHGMVNGC